MTEIRLDVKGAETNAVLVFDTDDIKDFYVHTTNHSTEEIRDGYVHRELTGDKSMDLHIDFKHGKGPRWETKTEEAEEK